ncbi:MAG: hypothetical protein IKN93_04635 [Bacteroidales bacterium]|nr:hypothetical protein [Bacteroidales bacterium]
MKILSIILIALLDLVPKGPAFLDRLQKRDSILVADQLEYGFTLDSVKTGTELGLADFSQASNDTLTLVRNWKLDTLKLFRKSGMVNIRGSVVIAPFEEGKYELPPVLVRRKLGNEIDTLVFDGVEMEVKSMPVDTATFVLHDIKGQIQYPVTFKEVLPYVLWAFLLLGFVAVALSFWRTRVRREKEEKIKEPAHITALRNLDKFRGNKFWVPEKQKAFYSGVTDTLKTYIEARFGVDAPEMTTAELFDALKSEKDITPELYGETKELFEIADFVKFAKHSAPDDYNAKVVPVAVRFVTDTYQLALEEEPKEDVL